MKSDKPHPLGPMTPYGRPLVVGPDGRSAKVLEYVSAVSEQWLQNLLAENPNALPTEFVDERLGGELFTLGTEVRCANGSIDLLAISSDGLPVVIETKLWMNPEARRKVVAQILDYACRVREWQYDDLERLAQTRYGKGLFELAGTSSGLPERHWIDRVMRNLRRGRMSLLIVGDGIRENAAELAGILSPYPDFEFRLGLVAMRIAKLDEERALVVPHVLARTSEIGRTMVEVRVDGSVVVSTPDLAKPANRDSLTEEQFFEAMAEETSQERVQVVRALRAAIQSKGPPLAEVWRPKTLCLGVGTREGLDVELLRVMTRLDGYLELPRLEKQLAALGIGSSDVHELVSMIGALFDRFGQRRTDFQFNLDLVKIGGKEREFVEGLAEIAAVINRRARTD